MSTRSWMRNHQHIQWSSRLTFFIGLSWYFDIVWFVFFSDSIFYLDILRFPFNVGNAFLQILLDPSAIRLDPNGYDILASDASGKIVDAHQVAVQNDWSSSVNLEDSIIFLYLLKNIETRAASLI